MTPPGKKCRGQKENKPRHPDVALTVFLKGNGCFIALFNYYDCVAIILHLASLVSFSPEPPAQSPVGGNGFNPQSDVYKMLQDYEEPASEPKQSGSFKYLQGILEAEDGGSVFFLCYTLWTSCRNRETTTANKQKIELDWFIVTKIGNLSPSCTKTYLNLKLFWFDFAKNIEWFIFSLISDEMSHWCFFTAAAAAVSCWKNYTYCQSRRMKSHKYNTRVLCRAAFCHCTAQIVSSWMYFFW